MVKQTKSQRIFCDFVVDGTRGQRGDELVISESGEILGLIKNPYNGSRLESFIVETFLEKLDDFKQYLY